MKNYKVGYLVGSLAKASINRKLASALTKLAPEGLTFEEIRLQGPATLQLRLRRRLSARRARVQGRVARRRCAAVRDARVQPLDSWWPEERNRLGKPALRHEFLYPQAVGGHRNLAWRHRHRRCATEPAQRAELLQLASDERPRSLHPLHARADHGRRRGHGRFHGAVPAHLYDRIPHLHRAGAFDVAPGRLKSRWGSPSCSH